MMIFIEPLFMAFGVLTLPITYPLFPQVAGFLAIFIGIILLFTSRDPEKLMINTVISIGLRFALQIILIMNMITSPNMAIMLLMFGMIDLTLAILTLVSIKIAGISIKDNITI